MPCYSACLGAKEKCGRIVSDDDSSSSED
jgi:hypothetical protein